MGFSAFILEHINTMTPISLRLPPALISALKAQARDRGLDMASYIRSQLIATLERPANVLNYTPKVSA